LLKQEKLNKKKKLLKTLEEDDIAKNVQKIKKKMDQLQTEITGLKRGRSEEDSPQENLAKKVKHDDSDATIVTPGRELPDRRAGLFSSWPTVIAGFATIIGLMYRINGDNVSSSKTRGRGDGDGYIALS